MRGISASIKTRLLSPIAIDPVLPIEAPSANNESRQSCEEASLTPSWIVTDLTSQITTCCMDTSPLILLTFTMKNDATGVSDYCFAYIPLMHFTLPWEWAEARCYRDGDVVAGAEMAWTAISYDDRRGIVGISQEWSCPGQDPNSP